MSTRSRGFGSESNSPNIVSKADGPKAGDLKAGNSGPAEGEPWRSTPELPPEWPAESPRVPASPKAMGPPPPSVAEAYRICGQIAHREAKNFYYAFRALPRPKRDAICAVYAFMRHADDLSDDETRSHEQRRAALDEWMARWHAVERGASEESTDPVFLALADAQGRFNIPSSLLDELVQGTAMDLRHADSDDRSGRDPGEAGNSDPVMVEVFDTYETFDELYRYCYLVASVVGLVCIRIFGYDDPHAEKLAEETGIAFQLTNILRDVREDAERGRIYLPLDDMERLGVSASELAHLGSGHHPTLNQRELFALQARRAEAFYQSANALLPLIAPDSRPALWVLVTIYHRLLERIVARNFDVFGKKVSVPAGEKLWILFRGLVRVFVFRIRGRGRIQGRGRS